VELGPPVAVPLSLAAPIQARIVAAEPLALDEVLSCCAVAGRLLTTCNWFNAGGACTCR